MLPFENKSIGFGWSDITDLGGDLITGTVHYGLETARAGAAFLSGDMDRAADKMISATDTLWQGAKTTYHVAGDVYDWATDAKNAITPTAPKSTGPSWFKQITESMPKSMPIEQPKENGLVVAGILAVAAKVLFF